MPRYATEERECAQQKRQYEKSSLCTQALSLNSDEILKKIGKQSKQKRDVSQTQHVFCFLHV